MDETQQQWEEFWGRLLRVLWCLAPEDHQRFGHMDIVFGVTMQDLVQAIADACDPDNDLAVWLRDEYVPGA